jgi:hypothetical protein
LKKILVILLLFGIAFNTSAQVNSVINYSFEHDTNCGTFLTCSPTPANIFNWYSPTDGSPDWCNPCNNFPYSLGMPQNYAGYQYARSGVSYAGIDFANPAGNFNEYITGKFSKQLDTIKKYCVEFFVSLADSLWWASSAVGAYLSKDSLCYASIDTVLPYIPQIENPFTNFLTDKVDWVPISGEYIAN